MIKLTGNMRSDDFSANIILEEASDVFLILIPLLEPEVELSGGNGVETGELQGKVSRYGGGGGQRQQGGDVRSDLESNPGPEGDLHDG